MEKLSYVEMYWLTLFKMLCTTALSPPRPPHEPPPRQLCFVGTSLYRAASQFALDQQEASMSSQASYKWVLEGLPAQCVQILLQYGHQSFRVPLGLE